METRTEAAKKTPGDLKREEIALKLGEGWKFLTSYDSMSPEAQEDPSCDFERQRKAGQIEDWRAGQKAFTDDGREIPYCQAVYIKPKAQVK